MVGTQQQNGDKMVSFENIDNKCVGNKFDYKSPTDWLFSYFVICAFESLFSLSEDFLRGIMNVKKTIFAPIFGINFG